VSRSLLTAYWIVSASPRWPAAFGVTAWSLADGLRIIQSWGYDLPDDPGLLAIKEDVKVADLDQGHIVPNMGPIVVRGLWYPFRGLGVPRGFERQGPPHEE
jgi:hypothetical protein